ncbi:hypothetical protein CDAR_529161 [Caerostris darwini]|uniref:Uncharacterized protein n=1 Tax=Caerostris darwini TaxID=1538125 RepID=A0AAV4TYR1_9ARAC|nr:hypothetical protein CDAR_529161 [Caerostris darwini]
MACLQRFPPFFKCPKMSPSPLIHRLKAGSIMEQSHGFLFHFLLIWKGIAAFLRQFVFEECNTSWVVLGNHFTYVSMLRMKALCEAIPIKIENTKDQEFDYLQKKL